MGVFTVKAKFYNPRETEKFITLEALVDTGATFAGLPASILRDLGIEPEKMVDIRLGDGYSIIDLEVEGKSGLVQVLFKEEGAPAVIGATALEVLGFSVDPVEKRLIPKPPLD